ncbi:dihydrolipoamide acetyltransferase family protein [Actinomadura scrupuli]|uniref:dihydrolipoamide acetyltransferase family protein n=1 Tax=Actinomadura scrupuli TaxID=559629 RepID=UPI003D960E40
MARLLRMPEVAAGATEAVLAEWLVPENTAFSAGDPIVVVETEKAIVEVEAESDALILKTLVAAGSHVEVGSPVAVLGDPAETVGDLAAVLAQLGVSGPVGETVAGPVAEPVRQPVPGAEPAPVSGAELAPASGAEPVRHEARGGPAGGDRVFASPLARQMVKRSGLSLREMTGTGPNGRIVRRDVERVLAERDASPAGRSAAEPLPERAGSPAAESAVAPVVAPAVAPAVRTPAGSPAAAGSHPAPHSPLRRAVARRLTESKQTIPHFYLKGTCTIDPLLALREELNAVSPERISVNDLVIKAVARAHVLVPQMNVIWTDDALLRFDTVDVAVAIASERGLVTPVLRSVDSMSVGAVATAVKGYVRQAADGRLRQHDLEGGSISVTNLGMFGVEEFAAIINPPQAAILAVGAGRPEPVVVDGTVEVATRMTVVLSVDHRAVDGALAAQWMRAFQRVVEQPFQLLV